MRAQLSIGRTVRILILITAVLVVLSVLANLSTFVLGHGNLLGLIPKFNMDKEANIPTLFSVLLLLFSAMLFYTVGRTVDAAHPPIRRRYTILAFIFLYIGIDEFATLHELLINPLRAFGNFSGVLHFSWVVAAIPLLLLFALYYVKFFLSLPPALKRGLFAAGALYVGGALGIEMAGGTYASAYGELNLTYGLLTTFEETLEIVGLIVLIRTLLRQLLHSEAGYEGIESLQVELKP